MKHLHWSLFFFVLILGILSCQSEPKEDAQSKLMRPTKIEDGDIFVRNPISYKNDGDTTMFPKMAFDELTFNFGEITEGEQVIHEFQFTNTGKTPLIIQEASSSCGCTVPNWPEEPIAAGDSGVITVKFNSENKSGFIKKPINIYANTFPNLTSLHIFGTVLEQKSKK